jgi:UDP-2,3-diacylglucosamine pyrophosphatase LpxH
MSFAFDLISDLHIETWPAFDWSDQATSPFCVVAGDISRDRTTVIQTLKHLTSCYQAVFYIDGNEEHKEYIDDIGQSYKDLVKQIERIPNVVYLQDNVVVIDGVAILSTNGWWGFDFNLDIDPTQASMWCQHKYNITEQSAQAIALMANNDAAYMLASIKRLQKHNDVKKIVVVTHTVPDPALIAHDIELDGSMRFNTMGNRYMMQALGVDTEHKVHTWCFGHYHGSIDQTRGNVRFVNNCRGRGDTQYSQYVYHPLRIVID